MADLTEKIPEPEIMGTKDTDGALSSSEDSQVKKTCADCGTSKTPLWRGGPAGPKSLCNACGIRSRKRRRAMLGLTKSDDKKQAKKITINNNNVNNISNNSCLNDRLLAIGREGMVKRRSKMDRQMRKLGEEEQAAVLLMAISYSSVYA